MKKKKNQRKKIKAIGFGTALSILGISLFPSVNYAQVKKRIPVPFFIASTMFDTYSSYRSVSEDIIKELIKQGYTEFAYYLGKYLEIEPNLFKNGNEHLTVLAVHNNVLEGLDSAKLEQNLSKWLPLHLVEGDLKISITEDENQTETEVQTLNDSYIKIVVLDLKAKNIKVIDNNKSTTDALIMEYRFPVFEGEVVEKKLVDLKDDDGNIIQKGKLIAGIYTIDNLLLPEQLQF